jgi:hypothetical protein
MSAWYKEIIHCFDINCSDFSKGRGALNFVHAMQVYIGALEVKIQPILKLGGRWEWRGQRYVPIALPAKKNPGTHGIGGLVGPNVGLEVLRFEPLTLHLIA